MISFEFTQMLIRLFICVLVNFIIIHFLYYPKSRRRDFYFTYMLTSIAVFFLLFFMMDLKSKATMGISIGLFGIFSIMRFRTDAMPVREMTYLFLIISLSVITAVADISIDDHLDFGRVAVLLVTDIIVVFITYLCEKCLKVRTSKYVQYDRVDLCTPEKYFEMIEDLKKRTGLDITSVDVGGIDFLKDSCVLKVYYNPPTGEKSNSVSNQFKVRKTQFLES
ncbi:MAG: DUF4956 domain-containing protein [Bacteroidaceae bacterium]|nr:DUF4956 domain-containing protein [Bacteroidaceae bacterium]